MLNKLPNQLTKIADYSVILFIFLFPIYFLPFTYDLFELNKAVLLVVFGVWFAVLLAVKSILTRSFTITTSYLTLPFSLLAIAYLISSVFSYSTTYSLWGVYGFLGNSFPVILASLSLVLTIPSLVSNSYVVKKSFVALSISFFIVVLTTLISFFQVIPANRYTLFLSTINASLVGGFIYLRFFLAIAAFLFSFAILNVRRKPFEFFYFVALLLTLVLSALVLDVYFLVFVLASSVLPLLVLRTKTVKAKMSLVLFAVVIFIVSSVLVNVPSVNELLGVKSRIPVTNGVTFADSWTVSSRSFGQRPFFGFGPSTFISVYSFFKPQSINGSVFWDTLFVKPYSYYMLMLTEIGLMGTVAFAFMLFRFVKSFLNRLKGDENFSNYALGLKTLIALMFLMFIATSGNVFITGILFILIALLISFEKFIDGSKVEELKVTVTGELSNKNPTNSILSQVMGKVFSVYKVYVVIVVIVLGLSLNFVYKVLASDIVFLSLLTPPTTLLQARDNYARAAAINNRNDFYQKSVIQLNRTIANTLTTNASKQKDLKQEQKDALLKDVTALLRDASLRANFITSDNGLNTNVQNWEVKGSLHQSTMGLAERADLNALDAYAQALNRNPLNPRIVASVGNVYFYQKKYQEAANAYYRAVQLKPDYAVVRYNLAKALEQLKQYDNAITVAKTVQSLVNKDSQDYKTIEKYISDLESAKAKAGETSKNTVNVDEATTAPVKPTSEQPKLTEPGEVLREQTTTNQTQSPLVAPTPVVSGNALPNQEPTKPGDKGFVETPSSDVTPVPTR